MRLSARFMNFGFLAFAVAAVATSAVTRAQDSASQSQAGAPVRIASVATAATTSGESSPAMGEILSSVRSLRSIDVTQSPDGGDRIVLKLDGEPHYQMQQVENPFRVVIDLEDTVSRIGQGVQQVHSDQLARVRTAQFQSSPTPVARVVLDMKGRHEVVTRTEGRSVVIDISASVAGESVVAETPVAIPAPAVMLAPAAVSTPKAEPKPAPKVESKVELKAEPVREPVKLAPIAEAVEPSSKTAPVSVDSPLMAPLVTPEEQRVNLDTVIAHALAPAVTTAPATAPAVTASQALTPSAPAAVFERRTIAGEEAQFHGKRISLNLVDADIKQVFRLFHEISGLNFVLDPSVTGRVTIVVDEVPWDQALDLILKNNGLDKVYDNSVIRIATTTKLAQEAGARKALKEAKELEVDTVTITRTLSYAKARDIDGIIKTGVLLSPRGKSFYDERTNVIIITDVPAKIDPIDRLLTSLDERTPQVMIEARIVETSRKSTQDLGISWGFNRTVNSSNPDRNFPAKTGINWDLNLPKNDSISKLGLTFGNLAGSFSLDVALDALETEGKARILSAPKIATQNNVPAEIEQGVQIPYTTSTNLEINTQFVAASLRMKVTPQITAEGTVNLNLEVSNDSPDFSVRTGTGPPGIRTQRATTKILVDDGGTTVIGGVFTVNEGTSETGLPGLRKIPFFGWLFKQHSVTSDNRELLVFITPKILK